MNTNVKNKSKIQDAFSDLLKHDSKEQELEFKTHSLVLKFMSEIDEEMERQGIKKKDLAAKTGTSASYITQVFSAARLPNHAFIIRMADALGIDFEVTTKKKMKALLGHHAANKRAEE